MYTGFQVPGYWLDSQLVGRQLIHTSTVCLKFISITPLTVLARLCEEAL